MGYFPPYGPGNPHPWDDERQQQGNPDYPGYTYPMVDGYYDPAQFERFGAQGAQEYWAARQQAMGYIHEQEQSRFYEGGSNGTMARGSNDYEVIDDGQDDSSLEMPTTLAESLEQLRSKILSATMRRGYYYNYKRRFEADGSSCYISVETYVNGNYWVHCSRFSREYARITSLIASYDVGVNYWNFHFTVKPWDIGEADEGDMQQPSEDLIRIHCKYDSKEYRPYDPHLASASSNECIGDSDSEDSATSEEQQTAKAIEYAYALARDIKI